MTQYIHFVLPKASSHYIDNHASDADNHKNVAHRFIATDRASMTHISS